VRKKVFHRTGLPNIITDSELNFSSAKEFKSKSSQRINFSLSISFSLGIMKGVWSTFVDLDECTSEQHNCHQHAVCSNNIGSFTCHCQSGYTGDGLFCEGIL